MANACDTCGAQTALRGYTKNVRVCSAKCYMQSCEPGMLAGVKCSTCDKIRNQEPGEWEADDEVFMTSNAIKRFPYKVTEDLQDRTRLWFSEVVIQRYMADQGIAPKVLHARLSANLLSKQEIPKTIIWQEDQIIPWIMTEPFHRTLTDVLRDYAHLIMAPPYPEPETETRRGIEAYALAVRLDTAVAVTIGTTFTQDVRKFLDVIAKMNKAGIRHNFLHTGNIVVQAGANGAEWKITDYAHATVIRAFRREVAFSLEAQAASAAAGVNLAKLDDMEKDFVQQPGFPVNDASLGKFAAGWKYGDPEKKIVMSDDDKAFLRRMNRTLKAKIAAADITPHKRRSLTDFVADAGRSNKGRSIANLLGEDVISYAADSFICEMSSGDQNYNENNDAASTSDFVYFIADIADTCDTLFEGDIVRKKAFLEPLFAMLLREFPVRSNVDIFTSIFSHIFRGEFGTRFGLSGETDVEREERLNDRESMLAEEETELREQILQSTITNAAVELKMSAEHEMEAQKFAQTEFKKPEDKQAAVRSAIAASSRRKHAQQTLTNARRELAKSREPGRRPRSRSREPTTRAARAPPAEAKQREGNKPSVPVESPQGMSPAAGAAQAKLDEAASALAEFEKNRVLDAKAAEQVAKKVALEAATREDKVEDQRFTMQEVIMLIEEAAAAEERKRIAIAEAVKKPGDKKAAAAARAAIKESNEATERSMEAGKRAHERADVPFKEWGEPRRTRSRSRETMVDARGVPPTPSRSPSPH